MKKCPVCDSWSITEQSKWDGGNCVCNKCNTIFSHNDSRIIKAGNVIPAKNHSQKIAQNDEVKCPFCGSTQITANKKGFGAGKALAGVVAVGGIGLLAGGIGSKKIFITCLKCGKQWKAGK